MESAELAHANDVDLGSRPELVGQKVTVVGGGLTAVPIEDGCCLRLANGESLRAHRVWLATGTIPDLGALRCLEPLLMPQRRSRRSSLL